MQIESQINNSTAHNCLHCGQFLISQEHIKSGYCCNGCRAAYAFIKGLGLDYFYCLRENSEDWASRPANEVKSSFKYFDDQAFHDEFVNQENGLSSIEMQLEGLHCTACIWILEKLKDVINGIADLRVNILTSHARVFYDSNTVKLSVIASSIEAMGYKIHPIKKNEINSTAESLKSERDLAIRLGVAAFSSMNVMLLFIGRYQGLFSGMENKYTYLFAWVSLILSVPVVTYSAAPFYKTSIAAIKSGRLHIDFPISFAILGGFLASTINVLLHRPEIYFDTVTALVFLLLCGRWFQRKALNKAANISSSYYSFIPLSANKVLPNGNEEEIFSASINADDQVAIGHNQQIPCDGIIITGESIVNNSILTGESTSVGVSPGSQVWAGTVNEGNKIIVKALSNIKNSRFGKILKSAQDSPLHHSKIGRFVDGISGYFAVGIVSVAAIAFFLNLHNGFWVSWDRVIALLVVSCPCALGISTPIALSLTNSYAARRGIYFSSSEALENLASIKKIIFDKTGTLTVGKMSVEKIEIINSEQIKYNIWDLIFTLEENSHHPVGNALLDTAINNGGKKLEQINLDYIKGSGIKANSKDKDNFYLGSLNWLKKLKLNNSEIINDNETSRTIVGLADEKSILALFYLKDTLRVDASNAITKLRFLGIDCEILSGDSENVVRDIANKLNIIVKKDSYNVSPEDKANYIKKMSENTAFVGDGINDILALKEANVGIAIAGGAETSLKTADIFLAKQNLLLIVEAIKGSRQALTLIKTHLGISLFYNITASILAITGFIGPLAAALIMPISSLSVILSSIALIPFRGRSSWQ